MLRKAITLNVTTIITPNGADSMTHLLDKAFTEASKLSPQEQDLIAGHILEELTADNAWQERFDESQDALSSLASEALGEFKAGQTKDLDPQ